MINFMDDEDLYLRDGIKVSTKEENQARARKLAREMYADGAPMEEIIRYTRLTKEEIMSL